MAQYNSAESGGNPNALILDEDPFDTKHSVHNILGIFSDKLYILNGDFINIKCELCHSFNTKMCVAACGHKYCLSCIYEDLADLCIAKCPVCFMDNLINREKHKLATTKANLSSKNPRRQEIELNKHILQYYTTYFSQDFDSSAPSLYIDGMTSFSFKGTSPQSTAEIFPITDYTTSISQSSNIQDETHEPVEILCRFHKDISPLLSGCRSKFPFTEDGLQRYHDHMLHCYKTNILYTQHLQLEEDYLKCIRQRLIKNFNKNLFSNASMNPTEPDSQAQAPNSRPNSDQDQDHETNTPNNNTSTSKVGCIISNNTMLIGNAIPASPISAEFLPYSMSFYSTECKRLFKTDIDEAYAERYSFQKEIFNVPPNRNPFVGHVILRRLIYDVIEHEQFSLQRDFWNCQVIFFINPYENINYFLFSNITLGLQIEAPDGRCSTYEFIVDRENFQEYPILRFYLRVLTFYEGRYSFTLKWSCSLPNAQTGGYTVFQSSEHISAFVAKPILGANLSPVSIKFYIESAPQIHPKLIGLLTLGYDTLIKGYECINNLSSDDATSSILLSDLITSLPNLGLKEIEALYLYSVYSHTVKDGCLFCIGCKAYAYVKEYAIMMNTAPFLHALIILLDRYPEVEIIQTPAIDLILTLGTTLPNFFSSTSIVGSSLLGRLRRIQHIFKNVTKPLKETIYMISQRAYYILPNQSSDMFEDFRKANELTRVYINREILSKMPMCPSFSVINTIKFYLTAIRLLRDIEPGTGTFNMSVFPQAMANFSKDWSLFKEDCKAVLSNDEIHSFYLTERSRLTPTPNTWREYIMLHIVGYLCAVWSETKDTLQVFYKTVFELIIGDCTNSKDFIAVPSFTKLHEKLSAVLPGKVLDIDDPYNEKCLAIIEKNREFLSRNGSLSHPNSAENSRVMS